MNSHSSRTLSLAPGEARRVGRGTGELVVLHGRVWVTAEGDENDRVLSLGQCLAVAEAHALVVEAWDKGQGAVLRWHAQALPRRTGLAPRLAGAARGFFAALARNAASSASRPQGCISGGDSIASSGAVK